MKMLIVCVGKLNKELLSGANDYLKRISRFTKIDVIEIKESCPQKEGIELLRLSSGCQRVSLTPEGNLFSSVEFSGYLKDVKEKGKNIAFIIGGPDGLSKDVKEKSDKLISFSIMTFPHTLFRVMLFEQIYRAFKIEAGHPYHR